MSKTVYILGAGFSMPAGLPSQSKLLSKVLESGTGGDEVARQLKTISTFIKDALLIEEKHIEDYALEDIYTPLDHYISENKPFQGYTVPELIDVRDALNQLIAKILFECPPGEDIKLIKDFAQYVQNTARKRAIDPKSDTVAIISTNWDTLLDNEIYNLLIEENKKSNTYGVLDYCCYVSSFGSNKNIKPGLFAIAKEGGYNVKLLKLHGSLNWYQCDYCERMYVNYNSLLPKKQKHCKHCKKNYTPFSGKLPSKIERTIKLRRNLIMPTFLKDLTNIQNKLVWRNAGVELSEASKVIFVGYSMPMADFEFRQLLSRTLRPTVELEVYLVDADHGTTDKRYQSFFSGRQIKIYYGGLEQLVTKLRDSVEG